MTYLNFIFLLISCAFFSPADNPKSPREKIILLPVKEILDAPIKLDYLQELRAFAEVNQLWIVGSEAGVYFLDKNSKKVLEYLKFNLETRKELFDKQDQLVGIGNITIIPNQQRTKILVITSNGIVFQVNLPDLTVEWLLKLTHRLETAAYSADGTIIAIGTRYDKKISGNGQGQYSTLFLLDSKTGELTDYFKESASIKKIVFTDNDSKLLVAYNWPNTDSFVWDVNNKNKPLARFKESKAYLYDIIPMDKTRLLTVNGNGISIWDMQQPDKKNFVFPYINSGSERILFNELTRQYILLSFSRLVFFDKQFNQISSKPLPTQFEDISASANDSLIILSNRFNNKPGNPDILQGFNYFNVASKKFSQKIDKTIINKIISKESR